MKSDSDKADFSLSVTALDHLVLTVRDIGVAIRFYRDCLGMSATEFVALDGTRRTALVFGVQKINLHLAGAEFEPKAGTATPGSADLCFISKFSLAGWRMHFEKLEIDVIEGPVPRTGALGPIMSVYVRDPDQNLIEISNYV